MLPNKNTNRQTNTIIQIQGVKRKDSGNYTCRVANTEGEGVSNVVALAVQCELHYGDLVIDDGDNYDDHPVNECTFEYGHVYPSSDIKQDKVNTADSAFIFLIIQSQS